MPTVKGTRISDSQAEVYAAIKQYGPVADHALVPLAQHMCQAHQSSSGIRSRRAELVRKGLVVPAGSTRTSSGRQAATFKAV